MATFQAPVAGRPGEPRGLSLARRGESVSVRWGSGGGAVANYEVRVTSTGGVNELLDTTSPSLTLPGIVPQDAVSVQVTAIDLLGQRSQPAVKTLMGGGTSACFAPATVTVRLSTKSKLRNAVALLGGVPVAVNRHGGTTLVIPLGGTPGRKAVLTIRATTKSGKQLRASYVFSLCSGRRIAAQLNLTLR